jgi:hypothetical protein
MYEFHGKAPNTRGELREYLLGWLFSKRSAERSEKEELVFYDLEVNKYLVVASFTRAAHEHIIFLDMRADEYIWYVGDRDLDPLYRDFAKQKRYPSIYELLDDVVEHYYRVWQLTG